MPKWNGGVIGVANNPTQSSAKGIWSLSEATKAIRAGLWPPSNAGADPYFENVTLLLPGDGTNGAQNNTFLDSSTNNFTITRNGNTTQGTFTPFSKADGRWSNFFDGTGDFLSVTNNAAFNFGSAAFTIEFWYYPTTLSGTQCLITNYGGSTTGFVIQMGGSTAGSGKIDAGFSGDGADITSTNGLTANTWNHIAISGTPGATGIKLFINGAQEGSTYTGATSLDTSATLLIGEVASTNRLSGYLSGLRLVKGGALYTATFTPSTSPPTTTVSSGTVSLLTCQSNRFIDNSNNAFAITRNGDVSVQTFSPFPTLTAYAAGTNGGSGYFDGSGDYLSVARNSAFLSTGDFTYELWVYPTATPDATNGAWLGGLGESGDGSNFSWVFKILSDFTITFYIRSTNVDRVTTAKVVPFQWNYVVVTRQGSGSNNLLISVNGANQTYTDTGSLVGNGSPQFTIGADQNGDEALVTGYISNARFLNGTGYTSVTIPTAPLTAITNTSLLLNYTNGGIIDTSMFNDLETVGNAQISTTQSKFGGASMYFDGTGDYLVAKGTSALNVGAGDFTIEGWFYTTSASTQQAIVNAWNSIQFQVEISSSGKVQFAFAPYSTGSYLIVGNTTISANTWYHFAVVRSGSTFTLYLNGTSDGTGTSSATTSTNVDLWVGANYGGTRYLNGYIDDLRITKGYARYTANFTAPVGPFNGFGD